PVPQQPMQQPVTPTQPPVPAAHGYVQCPGCLASLEPGARFCGECGFKLEGKGPETRIPVCQHCMLPLEPSAKFCGECGHPQTGTTFSAGHGADAAMDPAAQNEAAQAYQKFLSGDKPGQKNWLVKILKQLEQ